MHASTSLAPLTPAQITEALAQLSGWRHEDDTLVRAFRLRGFRDAIAFIVRLSFEAEARGHHPELFHVYDRVEIRLRTHDAGNRVTSLDVELAEAISQCFSAFGAG